MKSLYKLMEYAKWYPAFGVEHLLGIDLPDHQIKMLRDLWYKNNTIFLCSRRTGKTFISGGVAPMLLAMLFPGTKIGMVSQNFKTAQLSFKECEKIYQASDLIKSLTVRAPSHANTSWNIQFKNGSLIEAIPMGNNGDGVRGRGYNYLLVDEYEFIPNIDNIMNNVLTPMLFTKRGINEQYTHPYGRFNRLVISCTAGFKGGDYYKRVQKYKQKIEAGNDKYTIVSFDYRDGLESGIFEEDRVKEEFEKADEITRKTEYLNLFIDGATGYIGFDLLRNKAVDNNEQFDSDGNYIEPDTQIEFKGDGEHEYALIFDDADGGNDNFAVAIIKIDGRTKRLVRIITLNKSHIDRKIKIIREIMRKFNVVMIGCDQRHKNITDNLDEYYDYPDGEIGECLIEKNNDEALQRIKDKYGADVEFSPIIRIHNFTAPSNELRAKHFMSEIEKGRFKIPPKIGLDSKKEHEAYSEIQKTMNEIVSIQPQPMGKYIKYSTPSRGQTKDRFTVCELGCYLIDEYIKDSRGQNTQDMYIGKWKR